MQTLRSRLSATVLVCTIFLAPMMAGGCAQSRDSGPGAEGVRVVRNADEDRVDVFVGEERFTSYIFPEAYDVLKKPVLYPITTARGTEITRGYPLDARPGERADHPHHAGFWFAYGDVNGLDFWGHSGANSAERAGEVGSIVHRSVERTENGEEKGLLEVTADWLTPEGEPILREETRFVFHAPAPETRMIDRVTTFRALDRRVDFNDTKEGFLGLRVARELEMPSDDPVLLTNQSGEPADEAVVDNEGLSGHYRNSEGVQGYPDVWGKRAKWMMLAGRVEDQSVTLAILDHPSNPGYPTYWHARNYGLFSANALGQRTFTDGEQAMNFSLAPGESTTFRYRLLVLSDEVTPQDVEVYYQAWEK